MGNSTLGVHVMACVRDDTVRGLFGAIMTDMLIKLSRLLIVFPV